MPIYEYQCQSCGAIKEQMQKISDPGPASCEKCENGPMNKIMSKTGFILKGGGWYVTDFRDSGKKNPPSESSTKENTAKAEPSDSKSTGGSETKSDANSPTSPKSDPSPPTPSKAESPKQPTT